MGLLLLLAGIGSPAPGSEGWPGNEDAPASAAADEPAVPGTAGTVDPTAVQLAAQAASLLPPAVVPPALVAAPPVRVTPVTAPRPTAAAVRTATERAIVPQRPGAATAKPFRADRPDAAISLDGIRADAAPGSADAETVSRAATTPSPSEGATVTDAPAPVADVALRADGLTPAASEAIDDTRLASMPLVASEPSVAPAEPPLPAAPADANAVPVRSIRTTSPARRVGNPERSRAADPTPALDTAQAAITPAARGLGANVASGGGHDLRSGLLAGHGDDAEDTAGAVGGATRLPAPRGAGLRGDGADGDVSHLASLVDPPRPAAVAAAPSIADAAPPRPVSATPVADQVVQVARLVVAEGHTRMEVRLEPPALGAVRVTADAGAAGIHLTIAAEQPETRALLLAAIPEMQAALASRGVSAVAVAVAGSFDQPDGRRAPGRREFEGSSRFQDTNTDRRRERPARARRVTALDLTV